MTDINQKLLTGERACFKAENMTITQSVFADGESPLKESRHLVLENDIFRWKYPLWYSRDVKARKIQLLDTARSGIWYTHQITISDSIIQAPKTFRRSSAIVLENVQMPNAQESLWSCKDITLTNVNITGDYFGMNSKHIKADNVTITGNYCFDGAENIEISNSTLLSKDAFWNCKHVLVRDSTIIGEYLAWNSEDITFINCTIESNQGLCYMKHVTLENCQLMNSDLVFEYVEDLQADIHSDMISIKNPISGNITADAIGEIIFDDPEITANQTTISLRKEVLARA
ncbi:hydrogenase [Streptococcus gallolyticus]|uniref:Hydrogenase n=1 Tax=Streptococcus gallolyticus TaxID=315405 RepID=A0A368UFE8_9STRE|nr:DUF3737 family protein [Streptococcus gallolyticus]RCW17242.1 hydrogenase [Streptococcus gallolyticus]